MADKIDLLADSVNRGFDDIRDRFETTGIRIKEVGDKVDNLVSTAAKHGERLATIETKVESTTSRGDVSEVIATHITDFHKPTRKTPVSIAPPKIPDTTKALMKISAGLAALAGAVYALVSMLS